MSVACAVVIAFVVLYLFTIPFVIKESYFRIIKDIEKERKNQN
jgi:hypothetical protein